MRNIEEQQHTQPDHLPGDMQTTDTRVVKTRRDMVCVSVGEREAAAGSSPQHLITVKKKYIDCASELIFLKDLFSV